MKDVFYEYGAVIIKIIVILSLIAFIAATVNSMCTTGYNAMYLMVETFFKNLN